MNGIAMTDIRPVVVLLALLALQGCAAINPFQTSCAKPEDFAGVVDNAPLRVPAGKDMPDTRAALKIPALEAPEAPRPADSPCLDTPPKFTPAPPRQP
jgi:uncharacterized protein YcnI